MKSRRNRPDVRSLRSRAGRAGSIREHRFEALEERKLLFSITITPEMDFDGDGLGNVRATWGYAAPYIDAMEDPEDDADIEDVLEDFNDEPANPTPVPNPYRLQGSDFLVRHSFNPTNDTFVLAADQDQNDVYLRVRTTGGEFFSFQPQIFPDDQDGPLPEGTARVATSAQFLVADDDNRGLVPSLFRVEFYLFDQLVDSYTGTELLTANQSGNNQDRQNGIGSFLFEPDQRFSRMRIVALGAEDFRFDNLQFSFESNIYAGIVESRIFGAELSFTAPIGATVQVLDLYGRDMVRTLALGSGDGDVPLVDLDGDGIPNFNDGIGRIILTGVDSRASLTMFGGNIEFNDGTFEYVRTESFIGLYDDFEQAGFGYLVEYDDSGEPTVYGLPAGPGSLIFGAPDAMVRDNGSTVDYDPGGRGGAPARITDGFSRADQGVFVPNGESIGSVYIHGIMHGSSRFSGAVNELYYGYLVGDVTVEGDLGTMYVGAEAGLWVAEEDAEITDDGAFVSTDSQLTVGRTLGEVAVGGRSLMNVTAVGDLTDAQAHPPRDSFRYIEREKVFAFDDSENPEATIMASIIQPFSDVFGDFGLFIDPGGRTPIFNSSTLRNDSIMGSEFVGSISSAVQVSGTLGFEDPINGIDNVDMYAFPVSGQSPVSLQINGVFGLVRVLDQNGRPLAATEFQQGTFDSQTFTFTPPHAGVYYVEINSAGFPVLGFSYALTIAGIAPVTFGSYRTAGSSGVERAGDYPTVQALAGNMGMVRVGTGYTGPDGVDADPAEIMNRATEENDQGEDEDAIDMQGTAISSPGNLYAFVAGSDIRAGDVYVEGELGGMYVGMNPLVGGLARDGLQGDVYGLVMQVGGRVATVDIKGAVGINQDSDPDSYVAGIGLDLRTGIRSGDGSIGMIRIGGDVNGGTLLVNTAPGSVVGGLLVSQDREPGRGIDEGIHNAFYFGSDVNLGLGSDLRFADFPQIDILNFVDHGFELVTGQPVEFVDDGGGIVRIEVTGPIGGEQVGVIRVLPMDNGHGVAIARIDGEDGGGLDLSGGRGLRITGVGRVNGADSDTPISIGRIHITGADAQSSIEISGNVEIDVWRITSEVALASISNSTPRGDIVAVDVAGLNSLDIVDGNLGRTQLPDFGPRRIGPFLDIAVGEQSEVGGPVGVPAEVLSPIENLQSSFRPAGVFEEVYLDDIGSPLDPYLNGLVVRAGDVQSVTAGRGIGDVILQGGADLQSVVANADTINAGQEFEGIFGHIYAQNIDTVDVGAGLMGGVRAPFAQAGIFASDEIRTINVDATINPGAFLSGVVIAADLTNELGPDFRPEVGGVGAINVSEGIIDNAYIGGMQLDDFLTSYAVGEGGIFSGNIGTIGGTNLTIFRSEIEGINLNSLNLTSGVYDATRTTISRNIGQMTIATARNSTLTGGAYEFRFNEISAGRDLGTFTGGAISDLRVDVVGRVTGTITSDTWRRVEAVINGNVPSITLTGTLTASNISFGQLGTLTADAIRTSRVSASGEITTVTALTEIYNSEFTVSGPAGQIGTITAPSITGSVSASGPVGSIVSTVGDVQIDLTTTTNRGTVGQLISARDLILDTDISKGVGLIQAGRHLGRPEFGGMIFVRGNLAQVTTGGHTFTDVRVGGTLTNASIGPVANRSDAVMGRSGSFYAAAGVGTVAIAGDYGGNIVAYSGNVASVTITNGSLLPGGSVRAYDSDVQSVVIDNGNLYGDIYSDWTIHSVSVLAGPGGVFGDVGVNPFMSSGAAYDDFRGQRPPQTAATAGRDGPTISAGHNVSSVVVSGGSVFETTIFAGRSLGTVDVRGHVMSDPTPGNSGRSVFAAGGSIANIDVQRSLRQARIIAGVRSLGDDMQPGGFGDDADVTNAGTIGTISVGSDMIETTVAAGMNPGADRTYNTADDRLEIGSSSVSTINIGGVATGSSVFSDTLLPGSTAGGKLASGGFRRPVANDDIARTTTGAAITPGSEFAFSTGAGTGTIVFSGPGRAFFDAATSRVILHGTTLGSNIVVRATGSGTLTGFDIVSTEGASMGTVRVQGVLAGDSDIVIDEVVDSLHIGHYAGSGDLQAGAQINAFVSGNFAGGTLTTGWAPSVVVSGDFGAADPDVRGEAMMNFIAADAISVTGDMRGAISAERGIGSVTIGGALDNGLLRAGGGFGAVSAASVTESRISARDSLTTLSVAGDFHDSSVMVGGDLGDDAEVGGSRLNGDQVSAGFIGTVTIGGDFELSDIVAGYLRGPDGFFGTNDDRLASGRSSIGSVTIGGDIIGSNRDSEAYRIASTGALGPVTAGGAAAQNDRNLRIVVEQVDPLPIQIEDVTTRQDGRLYVATVTFNQPMDLSTIEDALSVSEVRGNGEVEIRLIRGVDYTLEYRPADNAAVITFSPAVAERDLPQLTDAPGPGVYRFTLSEEILRARGHLAQLDGDNDGRIEGDDGFSADDIVGDAGDKFLPGTAEIDGQNGFPSTRVDIYGPLSLDIVLDDNRNPDGLPDANTEYVVNGVIGDHPDHSPEYFSFASDSDIYAVTLQAGQILRLGAMQGPAQYANRYLVQPDGNLLSGSTAYGLALPFEPVTSDNRELTFGEDFLIRQTGTFYVVISNTTAFLGQNIPNIDSVPGGVGAYSFTVSIFDDGDTGFNATTDAGDGQDLVNAPAPSAFAGNDGRLGTADDPATIVKGSYVFRYSAGPDGVAGTVDDFVSGTNGSNVSSVTNALGVSLNSVDAAIGPAGATGLPSGFTPDVDVFHINGGNRVPTGSVIRATLKLSELGSDLGSRLGSLEDPVLLDNYVEFAVFDTTSSRGTDDALLLYAPTDVAPTSGEPGVIAQSPGMTYGYDENGDFYIEFVAPGRQDVPGADASYAIYVQGVINSDYRLEVVTSGSRELTQRTQNILLEVEGGSIDWLEVGGATTPIGPFVPSALGFTGVAPNGQKVDRYIVQRVTEIVQDVFDDVIVGAGADGVFGTGDDLRGLDVNVSSDPNDFEFQDFSTIFVTSSLDPIDPIFAQFGLFGLLAGDDQTSQPFGVSEHADAGNADRNDEAVVFVPSYTILGYTPSPEDLEGFAQSLAAGVARRAGELMGLRITGAYDPTEDIFDVMAANSVTDTPGDTGEYDLLRQSRRLSNPWDLSVDADFFLGYQSAAQLLSLYVRDA